MRIMDAGRYTWLSLFIFAAAAPAPAAAAGTDDYQILSQFGDQFTCDFVTGGAFIVWWDKQNDLTEEALDLLDSMAVYRDILINEFEMRDPPNVRDGYYFNIYLHQSGDVFPEGWGCGVGTDTYNYPYMTLPIGVLGNWLTVSHESWHVFGYSQNAPGFASPDANWYSEAAANWFAAYNYPDLSSTFLEAESLVRLPHVSMWLGYANFPDYYPQNWQRYVHQYGMALFLFYLTEVEGVPREHVYGSFYNPDNTPPQDLLPQEYLYYHSMPGEPLLRQQFVDWAARMTNDFDFILPAQRETAENEWNLCADPEDDNQFTQVYEHTGSGGWYRPPDSLATTGWSFNTYKMLNDSGCSYLIRLSGDAYGSAGDPALFRGKVLVRNSQNGTRFYDMPMLDETEGLLGFDVTPEDTEICFIVASVPEVFTDVEQTYGYQLCIERGASSAEVAPPGNGSLYLGSGSPNPFSSSTTLGYRLPSAGYASLRIFDLSGRMVVTIAEGEFPQGWHQAVWDGRDRFGRELPSGIYLASLEAAGHSERNALTLLRR